MEKNNYKNNQKGFDNLNKKMRGSAIEVDSKQKNELKIFNHEDFGNIRVINVNGQPWFLGRDVAEVLGYEKSRNALSAHVDEDDALKWGVTDSIGRKQEMTIINESGLYSLILSSKLPKAKLFKRWVTSEVLPTIRQTGGYVGNEDLFVDTYFSDMDDTKKDFFKTALVTIRRKSKIVEEQKQELRHKDNVIIGFANDVTLAEKRQILNRIVRKTSSGNYFERYKELYKQFELKYHCNLKRRLESEKNQYKPQIKNTMDYIDRAMNKIPELYDIAIKLYENDVNAFVKEMYELNCTTDKITKR